MRVMVMIKASEQSEAGEMPSQELLEQMTAYNEELVKAGVMLSGEGLHPSSRGARVAFSGSDRKVIDGPFTETKELLAGYWVLAGEVARRGDRVGQADPEPRQPGRRGRDPSGLRGRGLRRRADAGARERDQERRAQTEGAA